MAVRTVRRTHTPLPQAYRRQTLPLRHLRALLRAQRSPRAAHEAAPAQGAQVSCHSNPSTAPQESCVVIGNTMGRPRSTRSFKATYVPPLPPSLPVSLGKVFSPPPSTTPHLSKIIFFLNIVCRYPRYLLMDIYLTHGTNKMCKVALLSTLFLHKIKK